MSTATLKSVAPRRPDLDRQIRQAKTVLRELRDTLEDLDDRRELARAKKRNAGKRGTAWAAVKKELGFEF
jgi:ABC-type transporter Mla subunit MlaD